MSFEYRPPSRLMTLLRSGAVFWLCTGAIVFALLAYVLVFN